MTLIMVFFSPGIYYFKPDVFCFDTFRISNFKILSFTDQISTFDKYYYTPCNQVINFEENQDYSSKFQTSKHNQSYGLMSGGMLRVQHDDYSNFL